MKKTAALLSVLLSLCAPAWADSTIHNLQSGGTVQTTDEIAVARPSQPGQNYKVNVGSAAGQSIGTSGATVPLLNTVNTWSAQQSFLSGDLAAADAVFTGGSLLLPAGTTSQRPSSAVNGMIRYNSTMTALEGYVNGAWGPVAGASGISALTGDVTASGTGSVAALLATVNSNVGTFQGMTINAKGLVTGATNQNYAPLASPAFTGTVTLPAGTLVNGVTLTNGGSSTAFLNGAGAYTTPTSGAISSIFGRTGAVTAQSGDYTISQITGGAPIASPVFTGTVKTGNLSPTLNGTALPTALTGTVIQTSNADSVASRIENDAFGASAFFTGVRTDGTNASKTALLSGDEITSLNSWGYNGTSVVGPQASYRAYTAQNWSVGANGTYLSLATTPIGSSTLTEAMRVENDGGVTLPSTVTGGDKGAGTINAKAFYVNGGPIPVAGNGYGLYGVPVTSGGWLYANGDSITVGAQSTFTTNGYAYLIASALNALPIDQGVSGTQVCEEADAQVFVKNNPGVSQAGVYTSNIGTNDAINKGVGSYETGVFKLCDQAVLSWLSIPSTYKVFASASTQTGTWVSSSSGYLGTPIKSTTFGSTETYALTTYGGPIFVWYRFVDGDGGSFTLAVDGGATTSYTTATTPAIATGLLGTHGVGVAVLTGFSANTHNIVANVTSATSGSNSVEIIAVGTPSPYPYFETAKVFAGGVIKQQNDTNSAATLAYNNDVQADVNLLSGYGLPVYFVDDRNIVTNACMANQLHPADCGHVQIAQGYLGKMQVVANGPYSDWVAHNFSFGPSNFPLTNNFSAGGSNGQNNLGVGIQALNSNTTGSANTAVGYNALALNTTGSSNTAVGPLALSSNTTGVSNTAVGSNVLTLNTTGSSNTAVGTSTLSANTIGTGNTALGISALTANTTGVSNTAVGQQALKSNVSSSSNTAVGNGAANAVTTTGFNTAVGNNALNVATGGFNTAIGASSLNGNTAGTSNVAIGYSNSSVAGASFNQTVSIGQSVLSSGNAPGNSGIFLGTSNAVSAVTSGAVGELNIQNAISGWLPTATGSNNFGIQALGMRSLLGVLKSANLNSTGDQAVTIYTPGGASGGSNTKFMITDVWVVGCSISTTTAQGGLYSAASKGGTAIVASTQPYTSCQGPSGANAAQQASIATAGQNFVFPAGTSSVYFSLTTAQGAADTGDVYVFGVPLP